MNTKYAVAAALGTIAIGAGLAPAAARADSSADRTAESPTSGQARIADTTLKLENAFNDQFVRGKIDRSALPIDDVVNAFPETARPKVQAHIDQILTEGQQLAAQMTPEQRAEAVQPPPAEKIGKTAQAWAGAWGWPGYGGWGGYGAFGWPGMYGYGLGYGTGYGGYGYGGYGLGGYGLGCGGYSCGGLGLGGWYW